MTTAVSPTPDVHELLAACPGLLVGRIADGNRCDMTAECAAGSRCVVGSGAGGASGGHDDPYNPPSPPAVSDDADRRLRDLFARAAGKRAVQRVERV